MEWTDWQRGWPQAWSCVCCGIHAHNFHLHQPEHIQRYPPIAGLSRRKRERMRLHPQEQQLLLSHQSCWPLPEKEQGWCAEPWAKPERNSPSDFTKNGTPQRPTDMASSAKSKDEPCDVSLITQPTSSLNWCGSDTADQGHPSGHGKQREPCRLSPTQITIHAVQRIGQHSAPNPRRRNGLPQ